ncbi:MAG TPA: hypothetical protein VLH75_12700, partial [Longimicrobiales bacterium]|nr:hypothetical protein [Longimicrobiales bacterium]
SRVRALRVISRTSAMHFKGTTKQLPEIARELNVRYVLEGSVRRAGNSLRITAQLIEAGTDAHLWAEKYAGTLDDVFDMQEKVSRAIADALKVHLTPKEDRRLAARPLSNAAAYECYLRAFQDLMEFTPEALARAERHLMQAIGMVGEHPTLLAGLSTVHGQAVNCGFAGDDVLGDARRLADKALGLDPDLPEAHASRAFLCMLEGNFPLGIHHYRRAVAGNPADVGSRAWLALYYMAVGKKEASLELMEDCVRLDPINPIWRWWSGVPAVFSGEFEAALAASSQVVEAFKGLPMVVFFHAALLAYLDRRADAIEFLDQLPAEGGSDGFVGLGHLLQAALRGDVPAFDALLTPALRKTTYRDAGHSYFVADFLAILGRRDEALEWWEHSVDGTWAPIAMFERDPFLAPLRDDPRWERIMEKARRVQASVPD